ncbi:MAG: alpha-hydroxy acid oxidase, partial [Actinomycetota bacterium]
MTTRRIPRWGDFSHLVGFTTGSSLDHCASVADVRRLARRRVPRAVFDYTDGAAGDELSLRRTRAAFARVEFQPRVLRDVSVVDTSTTLLGRRAALPVVLGPTGFTRLMHHSGEPAVAAVAGRAGLPYGLSTLGTTSIEDLARDAPDTRRWFQLYLMRDRGYVKELVQRASDCGYDTIILTVDTPVAGRRHRDVRNGLTIPPRITPRTAVDMALHPRWWSNLLTTEPITFATLSSTDGTVADLIGRVFDPTINLADL